MQKIIIYVRFIMYLLPPIILGLVLTFIALCSMPQTGYRRDYRMSVVIKALMPEGWSFFTRSPREEMADIYRIKDSTTSKISLSNAEPSNFFGLSRRSRKIGMDISVMASGIPDSCWQQASLRSARERFKDTVLYKKDPRITTMPPGLYVISVFRPTPWAWRNIYPKGEKNYKLAIVNYDPHK